jgi:hypothetical protein
VRLTQGAFATAAFNGSGFPILTSSLQISAMNDFACVGLPWACRDPPS